MSHPSTEPLDGSRQNTVDSAEMTDIDADRYRATMRRHPAGVVIVTTMSSTGPVGFTATSFASLSLDPPLICFNITNTSSSISALRTAETMIVHLLGEHQLEMARRFSCSAEHRFAVPGSWAPTETGEPLLGGTATWMRGLVEELVPAGDSTLVVARLTHVHYEEGQSAPLIYVDGAYGRAQAIADD